MLLHKNDEVRRRHKHYYIPFSSGLNSSVSLNHLSYPNKITLVFQCDQTWSSIYCKSEGFRVSEGLVHTNKYEVGHAPHIWNYTNRPQSCACAMNIVIFVELILLRERPCAATTYSIQSLSLIFQHMRHAHL